MIRPSKFLTSFLALTLIAGAGLLVYWPGLHGSFIFDDLPNLVADPDWKVTSLDPREWHRAMTLGISSDIGRPLALLSFAINHYFTGLAPFPLKATGLAMHVLNGALVFLLCRRLFAVALARRPAEQMGTYAALMASLAWTLHPLQVSTALYIVQRMEVGAHTGVLLALLCYLQARHRQFERATSWPWFALTGLCVLLGLGFKETALLLPGYTLAIELCILRFRTAENSRSNALVATYVISVAAALTFFLTTLLPPLLQDTAYAFRDFSLSQRLLTQPHVLAMYLGQALMPIPNTLLFYYDNFPISTGLLSPPATLRGLILLLALAVSAYLARHRWPLVSLGITWFFIAHALTSNVFPLELVFEHRNYFALLGLIIASAQMLAWAGSRLHMDARRTLATLPVALLTTLCAIQAHTWGDPLRLATALATRNPDSVRASYDLGRIMLQRSGSDENSPLFAMAIKEFQHASQLPSSIALPEQALIIILSRSGKDVPTQHWDRLREKLTMRGVGPQEINAIYSILDCRQKGLCPIDDKQLLDTFLVALEQSPSSARLHSLYSGFAYNVLSEHELAITIMREAIALAPHNVQYRVNLARLLATSGKEPAELETLKSEIDALDAHGIYGAELARGFKPHPDRAN